MSFLRANSAITMDIDDILHEFEEGAASKKQPSRNLALELVTAMLNERMAPELLPYKHELINTTLTELQNQQQFLLDSYEYGDTNAELGVIDTDFKLQLMIIETDIERLSYLIRLYVRSRLNKIDAFTIYYMNETSNETATEKLLSPQENEYMQKHFKILTKLYNNSFLKKFPKDLRYLDDTSGGQTMIDAPDVDQPVFIRVVGKEPIRLEMGAEGELELEELGVYVVRYRLIRQYLQSGEIVLI